MKALVTLAFAAALATAGAQTSAPTSPPRTAPQTKLGLDDPAVPIAPATAKQPADAVLNSTGIPGAKDAAPEDSPVSAQHVGSVIKTGTTVSMQLSSAVDSGFVKNGGDPVHGTLLSPSHHHVGVHLAAGTKVYGAVVSAAKAGTVQSAGILSIQLTRVGAFPIVTDVADFNGREGHKDVADAAPREGHRGNRARRVRRCSFTCSKTVPVPGIVPGATLRKTVGGKAGGQGQNAGAKPGALPSVRPNTGPGVNQTPINGGSAPAQAAARRPVRALTPPP